MIFQELLCCLSLQVRHRVEAIVSFSHLHVDKLQLEQEQRHRENIRKKPKEFRSAVEMQVEGMLTLRSDYNCTKALRAELVSFTDDLKLHCGASVTCSHTSHEPSAMDKLKKLAKLVTLFEAPLQCEAGPSSLVLSLQRLITQTMITWATNEIQDLKLVEEVFSLMYRQFNEVGEVAQALKKTYVLEVINDPSTGKLNFDITAFCNALGSLRLLLKVGMSKKEENLLKTSLK